MVDQLRFVENCQRNELPQEVNRKYTECPKLNDQPRNPLWKTQFPAKVLGLGHFHPYWPSCEQGTEVDPLKIIELCVCIFRAPRAIL